MCMSEKCVGAKVGGLASSVEAIQVLGIGRIGFFRVEVDNCI